MAAVAPSTGSNNLADARSQPVNVNFNVVRTLGEGAFGEVKLVVDARNPNCALALKCLDLRKNQHLINEMKKEALLQKKLSQVGHENVIRYVGMKMDTANDEFQIFLEYADGGELFDQIEPDVGLPPSRAQFYFRQLLAGMEYIHSNGIAHRDIKPENLLLTRRDVLKISDFGMATVFRFGDKERPLKASCGTLPYVAPEVLSGLYYAEPADLWSCGIVLVTLLAGELPWESPKNDAPSYVGWLASSSLSQNPWRKMDNRALSLLRIILAENAGQRANMTRIRNHPWCAANFGVPAKVPSAKRRKLGELQNSICDVTVASQPSSADSVCSSGSLSSSDLSSSPFHMAGNSFSQPDDFESLLLSRSQISDHSQNTMDPLQCLVRRMTRFCVVLPVSEIVDRILTACADLGFVAAEKTKLQIVVTYRQISFIVSIFEMFECGLRKVMVDFRRSRGDGLEFKRAFISMKNKLNDVICSAGTQWLESQGLTHSQMGAVVYP